MSRPKTTAELCQWLRDCSSGIYRPSADAADLIERLEHENASLRAFVERVSKQTPEKPDYWNECGQCGRNASDAEELINLS